MQIANELVKMQVDSGASCIALPHRFLPRDTEIKKTNLKLTTYFKTNLRVLGVAKISLRNPKNKKYHAEFAIIDEDYTPLLGSSAAQQMGLIRGSPIGFPGSRIWLISRPGFGILKEKGDKIRNCNYDRDTRFGAFNKQESGNVALSWS